ncbi:putative ABC transporter permease YknZ [Porphyromonas levii]|uniref:ABC transporter permease n=1 Tax=Porphyromonas levii TaxID=28114 RepID=UPI001BA90A7E|nr:ABC transporter permease [Porphyromonas levii]MBR8764286.1 putative ABC transporter permease YknZ [Porphyromonas levii]
MLKQYIKQAWRVLRENPVLSTISILGTALAICMIMVMVMTYQIKNAPYPPEVNRDRTLYVKWMRGNSKGNSDGSFSGLMGYQFASQVLKPIKSAEAVAIAYGLTRLTLVSRPGSDIAESYDLRRVDEGFWKVFEFDFIDGSPFDLADVSSGLRKAVLSESLAKKVFGRTDVSGERIELNYTGYTVQGVVKDVSTLAEAAYGQLWTPITSEPMLFEGAEGMSGICRAYILAKSSQDFPKIRAEIEALKEAYNAGTTEYSADLSGQPDNHFSYIHRENPGDIPEVKKIVRQLALTLLLLLIVPAINLSGITMSQMRKRLSELGLRRSFGATRKEVMKQVMVESLMSTLLGGAIGLVLAFASSYVLKFVLFSVRTFGILQGELSVDPFSLITPTVFFIALLFCLLLNLLSALLPAWRVSRVPIVESLQSK